MLLHKNISEERCSVNRRIGGIAYLRQVIGLVVVFLFIDAQLIDIKHSMEILIRGLMIGHDLRHEGFSSD